MSKMYSRQHQLLYDGYVSYLIHHYNVVYYWLELSLVMVRLVKKN